MRNLIITIIFLFATITAFSQEEEEKIKGHELKLNAPYLLGGIPEISYEYLINDESGVGIDLLFAIDNNNDLKFALTPHYRFYFGKKRAAGFFVEGFGMLNTTEYYYDDYYDHYYEESTETDFALGLSVGGKFLTKKGVVFEIYGGVGRNLMGNGTNEAVPRGGLTVGKRF